MNVLVWNERPYMYEAEKNTIILKLPNGVCLIKKGSVWEVYEGDGGGVLIEAWWCKWEDYYDVRSKSLRENSGAWAAMKDLSEWLRTSKSYARVHAQDACDEAKFLLLLYKKLIVTDLRLSAYASERVFVFEEFLKRDL